MTPEEKDMLRRLLKAAEHTADATHWIKCCSIIILWFVVMAGWKFL